jgi:hypothetical protein
MSLGTGFQSCDEKINACLFPYRLSYMARQYSYICPPALCKYEMSGRIWKPMWKQPCINLYVSTRDTSFEIIKLSLNISKQSIGMFILSANKFSWKMFNLFQPMMTSKNTSTNTENFLISTKHHQQILCHMLMATRDSQILRFGYFRFFTYI